jgi:hypothetical protein
LLAFASKLNRMDIAVGVSDHYGSAEFVTVKRAKQGSRSNQSINDRYLLVARRRVALIGGSLASSPYHHEALKLPLADAERLILKVRASVADHCRKALAEHICAYGVQALAIQASPYASLPGSLKEVLASWHLTCAADGMMYRETIAECAAELGLGVVRYPRQADPFAAAAKELRCTKSQVADLLKEFGQQAGKPWRKEHRVAAANALALLAQRKDSS